MSRPPNYQELGRDQKREVTDQFLTTPCVRCGNNSHSCLDCSKSANDHNGHKTGPYGSLNPGKKLGADKWINELKEKYKKNSNDLVLHQAVRNRENQGQQQVPDQKVQKGKSKVEKKGQVQQGEGSNHDASSGKSNDVLQGLSPTPGNQSREGEASGVQNLHGGSDAVTPYNFDHDHSEIPTSRAPTATNLPERFVGPDRQASDIDPEKLHGQQLDYPTRTEFAKYKDRVTVLTNHFQLMSKGSVKIYEFKIPELEGKGKRKARAIMKSIINNFPELHDNRAQIATDYFMTIVSWVDLRLLMPNSSCISLPNDPEQYRLLTFQDGPTTLQYQGTVDMEELFRYVKMSPTISGNTNIKPMIDIFNMIISKCAEESAVATVPGGANKFYRKDAHVPLGNCKALCTHRGYSYTVKAGAGAVLLNVNTLTSAFWCPTTLDQVMNCAPLNKMDWNDFEGLVQGVRVYITYNRGDKKANAETYDKLNSEEGRIKPIVGLSLRRDNGKTHVKSPDQVFFTPRDGNRTSVMDHFNTTYGLGFIQQTYLPLVNLGTKDDPRWYPAEKLHVLAYQKIKGLVPSSLTSSMLNTACKKPREAKALVGIEGLETIGWTRNQAENQTRDFVLPGCSVFSLRPALLQVGGGILPNPRPVYESNIPQKIQKGRWKFVDENFYKRNTNTSFEALLLRGLHVPDKDAKTIFDNLVHWTGSVYSVGTVAQATPVPLNSLSHQTINGSIKAQVEKRMSTNMAVLVLSVKDIAGYSAFKDLCDRKFGLHALCITTQALRRTDGDRWSNITMKMNLKAAGINNTVAGGLISRGLMNDTLVLGADVTHPGPGSIPGCPSIAAIVGSVDAHAGRFLGSMRLQRESRKEIIDDVEVMVRERLVDWINEMTPAGQKYVTLPKRIIYYRDGVSEGQYDQVVKHELSTFGGAYAQVVTEFSKRVNPKKSTRSPDIVAIVCGKRHHVRFYPENTATADFFGNCQPGTTVDDVVTSPYYQDFYLQSHAAIKGTARPAHYFVIRNEDATPVDDLRNFTHELCYTYVRAPVGVSYASPAYYADRLCERGRCYLRSFLIAPKQTPVRDEFDTFQAKLEKEIKTAREKDFPAAPKGQSQQKRKGRQPKEPKLAAREEADKKKLQEKCDEHVMEKAREEFEKYRKGGNPWHPNISKTMFWM